MYEEILAKLGFSPAESAVYLALLSGGKKTVAQLVQETGLGRGNTYNGLESLRNRGLLVATTGKKTVYFIDNPEKLFTLLNERRQKENEAFDAAQSALPEFLARFAAATERPTTWTGSGIEAVKTAYTDMLAHAKEVCIFPSEFDRTDARLDRLIEASTATQKEKGIAVRAIFGRKTHENTPYNFSELALQGVQSRVLPIDSLGLKAQILVWEGNVMMNALKTDVVVAVVKHPDIAQSMQRIFDVLWELGADPLQ